jgi:hypothetical protein
MAQPKSSSRGRMSAKIAQLRNRSAFHRQRKMLVA